MLSRPTLVIVGAGASAEFGLPVGTQLRDAVAAILNFELRGLELSGSDPYFASFLENWAAANGRDLRDVHQAAYDVSRALPLSNSVDAYLDSHRNHELRSFVCKCAIARVITQAENVSQLACNDEFDLRRFRYEKVADTWLQRLWSVLQVGVNTESAFMALQNLQVITFNYDRIIERFLQFALHHFFDVPMPRSKSLVDSINVIHVYGSLGNLESEIGNCRSFRTTPSTLSLAECASEITTYTDKIRSDMLENLRERVRNCEQILFLGFSFAEPNMRLLEAALHGEQLRRRVFATAYGLSDEAVDHSRNRLDSLFSSGHSQVRMHKDTASGIFARYPNLLL